ncbi:hypothetical protein PybrP1_007015 [[Pythium] brassicae (nom. inval.)]|nr:hypothetical protein PybrP1_007015 [[Pythium] brassicae (nom. inval.)]
MEESMHDDSPGDAASTAALHQQQQQQLHAADHEARSAPTTTAIATTAQAPTAEFLLHVAQQINRGFQASLAQVVSDIGLEYGMAPASLPQTGDLPDALTLAEPDDDSVAADMRLIVQELQSARQKQRELSQLVSDLQKEQKLANDRLSLYAELALQLKRELVNERLAHIGSKTALGEARAAMAKQTHQVDSSDERQPSQQGLAQSDEDDPWNSPVKTVGIGSAVGAVGGGRGSGSGLLSFSSFYHTTRAMEGEDEPPSPMSSTGGGLHPLRGSLMDQFLPSSLLDSPQITPSSSSKSFSRKDDEEDTRSDDRRAFEAEIAQGLDGFSLGDPPCQQCKHNPVGQCAPCGHQVCESCEAGMRASEVFVCPRCRAEVTAVAGLKSESLPEEDNQVEHLREEDATTSKRSDVTSPLTMIATSPASSVVSPVTLSLLSEVFKSIPVKELEAALKEASGQTSLAIEQLLRTHPSFNPEGNASSSLTAGVTGSATGGIGGGSVSSPPGRSHKAALNRSSSGNVSDRAGGNGTSGAAGNWKTELCVYYLQGKCNKTRRTCSFAHGESDLVRPGGAKHSSPSTGYKTRLCPLYMEGMCPKSRRECQLAHGESDLRDGLSASGAVLPAAAPRLQSYKTELCYYYLKGCCNYSKEDCRFAHGESDLRTVEANTMEWNSKIASGDEY